MPLLSLMQKSGFLMMLLICLFNDMLIVFSSYCTLTGKSDSFIDALLLIFSKGNNSILIHKMTKKISSILHRRETQYVSHTSKESQRF